MKFSPFSKKQLQVLTWWCENSPYRGRDAIICDGAVRSGKTLCMSVSFVLWAFSKYSGQTFAFCGKTIASLRRSGVTAEVHIFPHGCHGLALADETTTRPDCPEMLLSDCAQWPSLAARFLKETLG